MDTFSTNTGAEWEEYMSKFNVPSVDEGLVGDDEQAFKRLTRRVKFAYPTLLLFLSSITLMSFGVYLYFQDSNWLSVSITLNSIAIYTIFTVLHEASHRSITSNMDANVWLGRISMFLLQPFASLSAFRFLHMQHHRYTNSEKDPDHDICSKGSWLVRPVKWMFFDVLYIKKYLKIISTRPSREHMELTYTLIVASTILGLLVAFDVWYEALLIWFVPARIAMFTLTIVLGFLPHQSHSHTHQEDQYKATVIREGFNGILSIILLNQNYHLVHHLYPTVPFYRYKRVWDSRKSFHLSHKPIIVKPFDFKTGERMNRLNQQSSFSIKKDSKLTSHLVPHRAIV